MSRLEELFERQRDGRLDEAQTAELVRLLDDPAERRAWWRLSTTEGALREALSAPHSRPSGSRPAGGPGRGRPLSGASRPWAWTGASLATLVALLVMVRLVVVEPASADGSAVATVLEADGGEALDGGIHRLAAGERLRPGARLRGACTVSLPDGSRLVLAADGELTVAASPGAVAHLAQGTITVEAAKRPPGSPLAITTPHAEVSVLGTSFTVDVTAAHSSVNVAHGRVRMAAAGSLPVEVGPGEYAEAAIGKPTWHWRPPAEAWRVDLAGHAAELLQGGWLGAASPDGLAAALDQAASTGVSIFTVATPPSLPPPGLVRFQPGMDLRLLVSLDRPAVLLIQVQLGLPGPRYDWLGNYQKNLEVQPCTREELVIPWTELAVTGTSRPLASLGAASVYRVLVMQAVKEGGLVVHRLGFAAP